MTELAFFRLDCSRTQAAGVVFLHQCKLHVACLHGFLGPETNGLDVRSVDLEIVALFRLECHEVILVAKEEAADPATVPQGEDNFELPLSVVQLLHRHLRF